MNLSIIKKITAINMILFLTLFCNTKSNPKTRRSSLAGLWYPSDSSKLASIIDNLLAEEHKKKGLDKPLFLILPHAGYSYSGKVAAAGYSVIKNYYPEIIFIIAPSHYSDFHGCSILPVDYYETPLGKVRVATKITKILLNKRLFRTDNYAHKQEHSIEIHLPFLQRIYRDKLNKDISIIPILVGDINNNDANEISNSIIKVIKNKKNLLFIISSDFTHFGERFGYLPFKNRNADKLKKMIRGLDYGAVDGILKKDLNDFSLYLKKTAITICGRNAIKIALALPINNFKADVIAYNTSGDITGDFSNCVSYLSIFVSGEIGENKKNEKKDLNMEFNLSSEDKKFLLNLARKNIESHLYNKNNIKIETLSMPKNCRIKTGVFVTLKKHGDIRGCIGFIAGIKPLYQAIIDNSFSAAFRDTRFSPLSKEEFKDIEIEISVLTIPKPVESIDQIKVGKDGLIIEQGQHRGLLLPQVPVEWHWDKEEFLIHTCRKAGLSDYAWKYGARLYSFQAIVFGENDL